MVQEQLAANKAVARQTFEVIVRGDEALAAKIISPDFINREAEDDDEAERKLRGPAGFVATAKWLREAYSDLRFEEAESAAENNVVMIATTMVGKHTGTFQGMPPTGNEIHHKQVHIFHVENGLITEHRAVRDDLGLMFQLGWKPRG